MMQPCLKTQRKHAHFNVQALYGSAAIYATEVLFLATDLSSLGCKLVDSLFTNEELESISVKCQYSSARNVL